MKATAIQIGRTYEVTVGRGTTIVKVLEINRKSGAWICETQNGKDITISDAKRFLKAIDKEKGTKKAKPKKESAKPKPKAAEPQAAPAPVEPPPVSNTTADPETIDRLTKAFKEADKRLRASRNAFNLNIIGQDKLTETTAEYDAALAALKAAGGKAGSGGRCLEMSGLDAAYQVLSETGVSMNARQICDMAIEKGYWEPQGATPDATISSAILTEIKRKGDDARFERTGKGLFAAKNGDAERNDKRLFVVKK